MTDRKISELDALASSAWHDAVLYPVVDLTEGAAEDRNKKMTGAAMRDVFQANGLDDLGNSQDIDDENGVIAIDFSDGAPNKLITLNSKCSLTFTTPDRSGSHTLIIVQDGTGDWTINWPTTDWIGGYPVIRRTAGDTTIVDLYYTGSKWTLRTRQLPVRTYNIMDDPGYEAARIAGDFNDDISTGFLAVCAARAKDQGCRRLLIPQDDNLEAGNLLRTQTHITPHCYVPIGDTFQVPYGLSLICESYIGATWAHTTYKPCIEIGDPTEDNRNPKQEYILQAVRVNLSNWTDDDDVGIRINACLDSRRIECSAQNFAIGLQLHSILRPVVHNTIKLNEIHNNKIGVDLWNNTISATWVNQNIFIGGHIGMDSNTFSTLLAYLKADPFNMSDEDARTYLQENLYPRGFRLYRDGTSGNPHNANFAIAPSIEIQGGTGSNVFDSRYALEINSRDAVYNRIMFARYEHATGVNEKVINVITRCNSNLVELSYYADVGGVVSPADMINDPSDVGRDNFVRFADHENEHRVGRYGWHSGNLGDIACQFNSDGAIMVPGLVWGNFSGNGAGPNAGKFSLGSPDPTSPQVSELFGTYGIGDDYIEILKPDSTSGSNSMPAIGVLLDVRQTRMLMLKLEKYGSPYNGGRIFCVAFDSSWAAIQHGSAGASRKVWMQASTGVGDQWASVAADDNTLRAPGDETVRTNFRVDSSVAYLYLCVGMLDSSIGDLRLRGLSVASTDGGPIIPIYPPAALTSDAVNYSALDMKARYYSGTPSGALKGKWGVGRFVLNYSVADSSDAWGYRWLPGDTWEALG